MSFCSLKGNYPFFRICDQKQVLKDSFSCRENIPQLQLRS